MRREAGAACVSRSQAVKRADQVFATRRRERPEATGEDGMVRAPEAVTKALPKRSEGRDRKSTGGDQ